MLQRSARLTCASSVLLVVSACASGELDPGLTLASVSVESLADLPACNAGSDGEVRFVASEEALYACVTSAWRQVPNNGPAGPQGATGPKGAKGNNGATGKTGLTSLIRTVLLDEDSTQCPDVGGILIETGIDANGNNVLDPAESKRTGHLSLGSPRSSLVSLTHARSSAIACGAGGRAPAASWGTIRPTIEARPVRFS